jgi:hypothetical protein
MSGLEVCANLVARIAVACHPVCPGDDHVDHARPGARMIFFATEKKGS